MKPKNDTAKKVRLSDGHISQYTRSIKMPAISKQTVLILNLIWNHLIHFIIFQQNENSVIFFNLNCVITKHVKSYVWHERYLSHHPLRFRFLNCVCSTVAILKQKNELNELCNWPAIQDCRF